jgi:hypothetical protein
MHCVTAVRVQIGSDEKIAGRTKNDEDRFWKNEKDCTVIGTKRFPKV